MAVRNFALFNTVIGACGVVWSGAKLLGVCLPDVNESATRARLTARFPGALEVAPTGVAARTIQRIDQLLSGRQTNFTSIALDLDGITPFHRKVYASARTIPAGETLSYGQLAAKLGQPGAARAVGQALGKNPFALVVPCHRVLAANGKVGGFTAAGGTSTKVRLLALERGESADAQRFSPSAAVSALRASGRPLRKLIDSVGPCTMTVTEPESVFSALAEAVVYQQLTAKAAGTIFGRVKALFPSRAGAFSPAELLRLSTDALRGAGLSGSKVLALQDLARRTGAGELPTLAEARRYDDEALVERLTVVRGIGRWTVQMLLMFRLGRPDVLPVDDYGIKKGFAITFGKRELPTKEELAAYGARWSPFRTVASWYLWRAIDLDKAARAAAKA